MTRSVVVIVIVGSETTGPGIDPEFRGLAVLRPGRLEVWTFPDDADIAVAVRLQLGMDLVLRHRLVTGDEDRSARLCSRDHHAGGGSRATDQCGNDVSTIHGHLHGVRLVGKRDRFNAALTADAQ